MAKLARARRGYYARKRKPIVREVPGPEHVIYRGGKEAVVVEKEVTRFIDRIVLIPRFGIRFPVHVNSLIRGGERGVGTLNNDGIPSNVTPLSKKVN